MAVSCLEDEKLYLSVTPFKYLYYHCDCKCKPNSLPVMSLLQVVNPGIVNYFAG